MGICGEKKAQEPLWMGPKHATWFEKKIISVPPLHSLMSQLTLLKTNVMEACLASVLCGILFGLECVHIVSILPEESGI